jgi:hypothetical protein
VAGVDQGISDNHVLTTTSGEDNNLGNVVTSERLNTPVRYRSALLGGSNRWLDEDLLVDSIGLRLVSVESHNGELLSPN